MLDRTKLVQELARVRESIFLDTTEQYACAQRVWQQICADPLFLERVKAVEAPWPVPLWEGSLDLTIPVSPLTHPYQILGVDGSQVYPDRHHGISCFLINIGSIMVRYGGGQPVQLTSVPTIFTTIDTDVVMEGESVIELVNGKREELELRAGLELSSQRSADAPFLLLFDGSLIFWHLESKNHQLQDYFLPRYLAILMQLRERKIVNGSYISLPKSKELVNLLRLALCDFKVAQANADNRLDGIVDSTVCSFFLPPHHRTIVFKNRSSISERYPTSVRPFFFYLNVGTEIGRVEIPEWIANSPLLVDQVAQAIMDQCYKGNGYPIVLAEAHEQAVVKGPDREFFYHLINRLGLENKQRIRPSQKLIKKRGIGI